jgi:hypothetical protein
VHIYININVVSVTNLEMHLTLHFDQKFMSGYVDVTGKG